jgi:hypothetical protein
LEKAKFLDKPANTGNKKINIKMAVNEKYLLDYSLKIRLPVTIFLIILTALSAYYYTKPVRENIGYQPAQPVNFSHRQHAGDLKLACVYCHTTVGISRYASVPSTNICINCHKVVRTERPEIIKLTDYYNQDKPVPWKRVHKLPDFAYFNHSAHINAGFKCETCHGPVSEMVQIRQVRSFNMSDCLACHRNAPQLFPEIKGIKKGPDNCFACHR